MYFKYIKDPFPRAALFTITSQQVNMGIKLLKKASSCLGNHDISIFNIFFTCRWSAYMDIIHQINNKAWYMKENNNFFNNLIKV